MILIVKCKKCSGFYHLDLGLGKQMSSYYLAVFICRECGQVNLAITFTRMLDQYQVYALEENPIKDCSASIAEKLEYMSWAIGYVLHRLDVREHFGIDDHELEVMTSTLHLQFHVRKEAVVKAMLIRSATTSLRLSPSRSGLKLRFTGRVIGNDETAKFN